MKATAERIYDPPPEPPRTPSQGAPIGWAPNVPQPLTAGPQGGDGPAASHDPERPEPTETNGKPILEGSIVTTAIGSGESTTYEQTCLNAAAFREAAAIHLDQVTAVIAEAEALAEANRKLAEDLAGEDMDAAVEAAAAADAAEAYAAAMREVQSKVDVVGGQVAALNSKLEEHQGVADAIRSRGGGAANRTDYYAH